MRLYSSGAAVLILLLNLVSFHDISAAQSDPRRLYIFCVESRIGIKFWRYMNVWNQSLTQLRSDHNVRVNILQARWDSKSTTKFLAKPLSYLAAVNAVKTEETRAGRNVNDAHVILIDSDTLWTNPTVHDVWRKYDEARNGKELVVATETNCWLGRYCSESDVYTMYANTPPAYSVFVNSGAIMGSLAAIVQMLENITTSSAMYFITTHTGQSKFDDQYAVAVYSLERPQIVALDIRQTLFGTYQVFDPQFRPGSKSPYVCRTSDKLVTNVSHDFNFHCSDITPMVTRRSGIYVDADSCAIRRNPNNTRNSPAYPIISSMASDPVVWHGNGGGKRLYSHHRTVVLECLLAKHGIDIEKYKCNDEGCSESNDFGMTFLKSK
mmetsp:Transcript_23917/g.35107  ORF Transcript_23917/g.35107 Transcript_23917/m.35107 type:complete len:380 (+) Transcript_23917:25-1164(+)